MSRKARNHCAKILYRIVADLLAKEYAQIVYINVYFVRYHLEPWKLVVLCICVIARLVVFMVASRD